MFLKQINYKTCRFIMKTVKNTQEMHFQKIRPDFKE